MPNNCISASVNVLAFYGKYASVFRHIYPHNKEKRQTFECLPCKDLLVLVAITWIRQASPLGTRPLLHQTTREVALSQNFGILG